MSLLGSIIGFLASAVGDIAQSLTCNHYLNCTVVRVVLGTNGYQTQSVPIFTCDTKGRVVTMKWRVQLDGPLWADPNIYGNADPFGNIATAVGTALVLVKVNDVVGTMSILTGPERGGDDQTSPIYSVIDRVLDSRFVGPIPVPSFIENGFRNGVYPGDKLSNMKVGDSIFLCFISTDNYVKPAQVINTALPKGFATGLITWMWSEDNEEVTNVPMTATGQPLAG